jgi:hypothetical protein
MLKVARENKSETNDDLFMSFDLEVNRLEVETDCDI